MGELFVYALQMPALLGHRSDFDSHTVIQCWTLFGDFQRFIEIIQCQEEIAADGFLGLGKRTVCDRPSLPGNNFPCRSSGWALLTFPCRVSRSNQAFHWPMIFWISSGDRSLSQCAPRNNSMYSDVVVCVLIFAFLVMILFRFNYTTNERVCPGQPPSLFFRIATKLALRRTYRGSLIPTPECVQAIELLARKEGLLLDPVYNGKAMAGLSARAGGAAGKTQEPKPKQQGARVSCDRRWPSQMESSPRCSSMR